MPHAFILGGTGQIGRATAAHLLDHGWTVALAHRGHRPAPAELAARGAVVVTLDREQPGALGRALAGGADLLVDAVAYGPDHAAQVLEIQSDIRALVVISSSSVYRDGAGRTLDEAAVTGFPVLPEPIGEDQPTVEPGPATYSTRKVALEHALLARASIPVTILRPAAIHGPGSTHPREWWLVKRVLDHRPAIPLAYRGLSRFHTTAAPNIAAAVRAVAMLPGQRILNVADPTALSVAEIAALVARHLGFDGDIVEVDDMDGYPPTVGRTPWSVRHPFVLDTTALKSLGYGPLTDYAGLVASTCDWLTAVTASGDWPFLFPVLAKYPYDLFDYRREDAWLASRPDLPPASATSV